MPETIKWNFQAAVVGGPTMVAKGEVQVDAYTKIDVAIPANGNQTVEILTGEGGALQFLFLNPKSLSSQLRYQGGAEPPGDSEGTVLDGPHVLIGVGAVGLLSETVSNLTFRNDADQPASIAILTGRDATP